MVTASADTTAKLWDVPSGRNYFTFDFDRQGARGTAFSLGGQQVCITVDPFMGTGSSIRIFKMFEDRAERASPPPPPRPPPALRRPRLTPTLTPRRAARGAAGAGGP